MERQFSRTELLIGEAGIKKLEQSHVIVFGVGGVGGYAVEALARAGVGQLSLVDGDVVSASNINRQILALHSTVGQPKVTVMAARIHDINPACTVTPHCVFFLPDHAPQFNFAHYDYVIDAVDTVSAKLAVITAAKQAGTRVISSMGAGNKFDPMRFKVADIAQTRVCPLARIMRRELRVRGITDVKTVYSDELPAVPEAASDAFLAAERTKNGTRRAPGSVPWVPPVVGLLIAHEVVNDLLAP
ncbi:MAG: tRNA threonylcarbamoyladenosine dehydratase [Treponema sp.]|nr:tRNA threonylcarbamoyladenosine dehydratase [Treponema sp.]